MDKKTYIIPRMNSRHLILGGAIAQIPVYDNPVSGGGGLTKERNEEDMVGSEGWTEKGLW